MEGVRMEGNARLQQVMDVGTGLCFIVFPLVFTFAFAVHPGLLHPQLLAPEGLIVRAHNAGLLQFGHVLVTLNTALAVVIALRFMRLLERTPWATAGLVGGAAGILGACILAADKGALCLTMTALDTVPADAYALLMPGLLAMFSLKGWMALLWGVLLLPMGFAILAVALVTTIIAALRVFDLVYVTTRGGPGDTTLVTGFLVYRAAFQQNRLGYATAVATVMTLLIFAISQAVLRLQSREES